MPVLILDGVEFAPLELAPGLTQGCLASCMLYIIGVDPLLSSLQQTPHISGVSGFVDDCSMGCRGLPAISAVSNLIHDFEQASGQQINRGKSALVPARQLSDDERASCLATWNSDIRISSRERVLGVFIGIHVSIHDQYYNAVHKFDLGLSVFGRVQNVFVPCNACARGEHFHVLHFSRTQIVNSSCRVLLLQEIERKVLRFLTPITWATLDDTASCYRNDGREACWLALSLFFATWTIRSMHKRGVHFLRIEIFNTGRAFQCRQCVVHSRSLE